MVALSAEQRLMVAREPAVSSPQLAEPRVLPRQKTIFLSSHSTARWEHQAERADDGDHRVHLRDRQLDMVAGQMTIVGEGQVLPHVRDPIGGARAEYLSRYRVRQARAALQSASISRLWRGTAFAIG